MSTTITPPTFVESFLGHLAGTDLEARPVEELTHLAQEHWTFGARRRPGEALVEVQGHGDKPLVVRVVTDDMPFIVDSVTMTLTRHGLGIHLIVDPVLEVRRDADGRVVEVTPLGSSHSDAPAEAWMTILADRTTDSKMADLSAELQQVLAGVRVIVDAWPAMRERVASLADAVAPNDREGAAFLRWLTQDRFTFLALADSTGTRLGLAESAPVPALPGDGGLAFGRSREISRVHHPRRIDLVQVRTDGQTTVVAGLYTERAFRQPVGEIPVVRQKIASILRASGLSEGGHRVKELRSILEAYPREELFVAPTADVARTALGVLELGPRRLVKGFVRYDAQAGLLLAQVYLPRDRYTTGTVRRIEQHLREVFGALTSESSSLVTDSVLARVHVVLPVDEPPTLDPARLDSDLAELTRTWAESFHEALVASVGPDRALELEDRWLSGLPDAYRVTFGAATAVADLAAIDGLDQDGLASRLDRTDDAWHLRLYHRAEAVELSQVLPVLENTGVRVVEQRPFLLRPADGPPVWVADLGLEPIVAGDPFAEPAVRVEFLTVLRLALEGTVENDPFNALVLTAGLGVEMVVVLRAYARYRRQVATAFSDAYVAQALSDNGPIAHLLVELFTARLDPGRPDEGRAAQSDDIVSRIEAALVDVASLDQDRILTSFMRLVLASVRTTFFQPGRDSPRHPFVAFKFDPAMIPELPLPKPVAEVWVYSPRTEAIHMRGGRVARGGIRWSDRREDFRTEVLGLMKAQMVKNAVIVPTGAKGGFVVKQSAPGTDTPRAEVIACYELFMSALLALTDNIVSGTVVPPPSIVRYDGDDPYLVVAADKGTATFSDIANGIALEHGFWLGDAFASGGSTGYDHKAMGITARGAWESVRRHVRSLGLDPDTAELTVVGIGDMSGDVFGNGLLRSPHLRVVAAFDHRHVFLDPTPDPAASFAERRRLFALLSSSWDDYDRNVISAGGGVWPRSAKSVPLSAMVRRALAVDADHLSPADVVSAVLRAPVDLLWNGGIGTFVKALTESHAEVGDRANDAVRVDGSQLRCRVVAEGGNLGFTQRGRVEYALAGGLINTDAIDNSAGVDCSDHEVNLKILLDSAVAAGELTCDERNRIVADMTEEVAELVLEDNRAQTLALANARHRAAPMLDVHARYIRALATAHLLDRDLEYLPNDRQIAERQAAGLGLTAPELAVLLAYAKTTAIHEMLGSRLPDDPALRGELSAYFPGPLVDRFARHIAAHRLRREIVATRVVNQMVNRAGVSFAYRMNEEFGAALPDIVAAHVASARIFDLDHMWNAVDDLAVAPSTRTPLLIELRDLVERGVQWLLHRRRPPLELTATVEAFAGPASALAGHLPELAVGADRQQLFARAAELITVGVPDDLALAASGWPLAHLVLDLVEVAAARAVTVERAAAVAFVLSDRLGLDWLRRRIDALPGVDRWQAMSRSGLRDEFTAEWRGLTADVLRVDREGTAADLVDGWLASNEGPAARCREMFATVRAGGMFDLATLSVCIRAVRNLAASGGLPS